jgi:hypothetical protein
MKNYDNMLLHELLDELDMVILRQKDLRRYRDVPKGYTLEQALQELEEEEIILRDKIEELSIVELDYTDEWFND